MIASGQRFAINPEVRSHAERPASRRSLGSIWFAVPEGVDRRLCEKGIRPSHAPESVQIVGLGRFPSGLSDRGSSNKHLKQFGGLQPVWLDTGTIAAPLDRSGRQHQGCKDPRTLAAPLVTCEGVIVESGRGSVAW